MTITHQCLTYVHRLSVIVMYTAVMIIEHSLWPVYCNQCFMILTCFISSSFDDLFVTLRQAPRQEEPDRREYFEVDSLNDVCINDAQLTLHYCL